MTLGELIQAFFQDRERALKPSAVKSCLRAERAYFERVDNKTSVADFRRADALKYAGELGATSTSQRGDSRRPVRKRNVSREKTSNLPPLPQVRLELKIYRESIVQDEGARICRFILVSCRICDQARRSTFSRNMARLRGTLGLDTR